MRVEIVHTGGRYAERVIAYFRGIAPDEVDVYQVPQSLPPTLEAVESLPTELGAGDVIIALGLQAQQLLAIPPLVAGAGTQALIVPVEDATEMKPALERQLLQACRENGLEGAFPRPFCALQPKTPVVTQFCEEFGAGAPSLQLEVEGGRVSAIDVLRGAPCGLTDFVAEGLVGQPAGEKLAATLRRLHASYPCLAGTDGGANCRELALSLLERGIAGAG